MALNSRAFVAAFRAPRHAAADRWLRLNPHPTPPGTLALGIATAPTLRCGGATAPTVRSGTATTPTLPSGDVAAVLSLLSNGNPGKFLDRRL